MSDRGCPYNYGLFYVTKTNNIKCSREIVLKTKFFHKIEMFNDDQKIDNIIIDLVILYWMQPWIAMDSFKDTQYENIIIKWHDETPYIRKLNFIEKIYFNRIKKAERILE